MLEFILKITQYQGLKLSCTCPQGIWEIFHPLSSMSELQYSAPPRPRSSSCSQNISPGSHFLCRSLLYRGNSEQWSANIVFSGQCYLNNLFVKSETKLTSFLFSRSLFLAESETAFWSLTSTSTSLTLIFTFEANSASSLSIGIMGWD